MKNAVALLGRQWPKLLVGVWICWATCLLLSIQGRVQSTASLLNGGEAPDTIGSDIRRIRSDIRDLESDVEDIESSVGELEFTISQMKSDTDCTKSLVEIIWYEITGKSGSTLRKAVEDLENPRSGISDILFDDRRRRGR